MSDLEARIAEVHIAHLGHVFFNVSGDNRRWSDKCVCGVELFGSENSPEHQMYPGVSYAESAHAAHVAQMLAPVIREAQAEAWDACVREADNRWHIGHASAAKLRTDNHYRSNDE